MRKPVRVPWLWLFWLFFMALSPQTHAAQPIIDPEELVTRQLIVLYSATTGGFKGNIVAAAASNASVNAGLHARLGSPASGTRLLEGLTTPAAQAQIEKTPDTPRARLENYVLLTYPAAASATAAMKRLQKDDLVLSVERNALLQFFATPNDRYFSLNPYDPSPGSYQWGMQLLKMPQAWDKIRGNAYIADADTGIAYATRNADGTLTACSVPSATCLPHPDLAQNLRPHMSMNLTGTGLANEFVDESTHGTHVAGIMAATPQYGTFGNNWNNSGVAGVCWNCSFSELKIISAYHQYVSAISYAADHGLQALNMSFGDAPSDRATANCAIVGYSSVCQALEVAKMRDVVLVASAGNYRHGAVASPARYPGVIAVGGLQYNAAGPTYWNDGYGNSCANSDPDLNNGCGSNYGPELAVMAPAKDIVSTVLPGGTVYDPYPCGDSSGPDSGRIDGYGDCTGTSMSAPYITGLAGLVRSANPLLKSAEVRALITGNSQPCVGAHADRCYGTGAPDAGKIVAAALGGPSAVNRLTPLFSFFGNGANGTGDHFYTTVPQMAVAAMRVGMLLPQPASGDVSYRPIGAAVPGYSQFPTPPCTFSPCETYPQPKAAAMVFTSHANPMPGGADLVPLHRYSQAMDSPSRIGHFYSTDTGSDAKTAIASMGYQLDGIEGYVFPNTLPSPPLPGMVKLCRKYDDSRYDWVLFPDTGNSNCAATTDGYTGGSYGPEPGWATWIGWVAPVSAPTAICAQGTPCRRNKNLIPILMILLD